MTDHAHPTTRTERATMADAAYQGPTIRPLEPRDRDQVMAILHAVGNFSSDEIDTALELIDEWLTLGEASDYLTYVVESDSEPAPATDRTVMGYVCYGPTPLTESTYDLYWIAVSPSAQRGGYGRALLAFAESDIARRGGRRVLIETGSHETYASTVRFYERAGYGLISRIPDYYRPGDDKLTFGRPLPY